MFNKRNDFSCKTSNDSIVEIAGGSRQRFPLSGLSGFSVGVLGRPRKNGSQLSNTDALILLIGFGFDTWRTNSDNRDVSSKSNNPRVHPKLSDVKYHEWSFRSTGHVGKESSKNALFYSSDVVKVSGGADLEDRKYTLTESGKRRFEELATRVGLKSAPVGRSTGKCASLGSVCKSLLRFFAQSECNPASDVV